MNEKRTYMLSHDSERRLAMSHVASAPGHFVVEVRPVKRTEDQSAKFHAMCGDFEKSGIKWSGKPRSKDEWKVLFISGHSVATGQGAEVVAGLEGELVNVRESSATMGVRRGASLIEYVQAMGAQLGIVWSEPVEETQ
jgi:hypothetical protein